MAGDDRVERAIQALLDGKPLAADDRDASADSPIRVIDAIARAHRAAIYGTDAAPDHGEIQRWGHLELRAEIGRGTSGTVYRAWDTHLARDVALKLLTPEAGPLGALEEGRLLARVNHPHIVRVHGADTHAGVAGIWMELLDGETLDEILERDGAFSEDETVLIGLDLAHALAAIHSAGLLHRDIKTRNVLRERGGRIVLTDLGAARTIDIGAAVGDATGTPMYMAPEVLHGSAATAQSDIYGLGVLLYRLLTGGFPVMARDLDSLRCAHAAGQRVSLKSRRNQLAAETEVVIERACHPDNRERYASAAELEAALSRLFARSAERRAIPSVSSRRFARWRRTMAVAAGVTVAAGAVAWGGWDTTVGRATRRGIGLMVPPRSPLYLAVNGGLVRVEGSTLSVTAHNPATALVIAAATDVGIRTRAGMPPWVHGAAFRLDGTPIAALDVVNDGVCCFSDGTTDGDYNYSVRQDSTLLEPIGSRPLAPAAVYRFAKDWSSPELLFALAPEGPYAGITYSPASSSFFLTRTMNEGAVVEQWSRDGRQMGTPIRVPAAVLSGIAADPRDGTLWIIRDGAGPLRLENFSTAGTHLGTFEPEPRRAVGSGGAEFAWVR